MNKVITRYVNRKLYNHSDGGYTTLTEIREAIQGGDEITVTCKRTKNNITDMILQKCLPRVQYDIETMYSIIRGNK